MHVLLGCIVVLLAFGGILWGLLDTRRIIEAPFLYSVGLYGITCFQIVTLLLFPNRVDPDAFTLILFLTVVLSIFLFLGYRSGRLSTLPRIRRGNSRKAPAGKRHKSRPIRRESGTRGRRQRRGPRYQFIHSRVRSVAIVLGILGFIGNYKLRTLPPEALEGLWTGWPVYFLTMSRLATPAMLLTILLALIYRTKSDWILAAILAAPTILFAIIESGRRSAMLTLPFALLIPLVLLRNYRVPRYIPIVGLLLVPIIVYVVPVWRGEFAEGRHLEVIQEKKAINTLRYKVLEENESAIELADAAHVAGAHLQTGRYEYGAGFYNKIVHQLVPGSLLGREFKESLMIPTPDLTSAIEQVYGRSVAFYTAKSIYADLFAQFWFLSIFPMYGLGWTYGHAISKVVDHRDYRWMVFLSFFGILPAGFAYGAITTGIAINIFNIVVLFITIRFCIRPSYRR